MRASVSLTAGLIALVAVFPHPADAGSPPAAFAASAGPAIVGTVNDSAGNPLSNVQVILGPLNRTTTTTASGSFEFRGLPAGTYHLSTLQIGFAPAHADVVLPAAGEDIRVRIVLRRTALQLASVQVTATPGATDARNVAQSTVEVSGEALARNLAPTVAQTLSREPGLAQRFGGPGANTPVIRGLSGERVLVLQDGGRAADLSSTSSDHSLSIDPLAAQRIEVVRGPASLLYGNNALGGVVNVISNDIPTQIPSHVDGSFATQGETATPGGAIAGGAAVPLNSRFALVARGSARRGGDMRQGGGVTLPNSYLRNASGVGGFAFSSEVASGGAIYRGYGFNYGLPSPPDAGEAGVHIEGRRHELNGRLDLTPRAALAGVTSLRINSSAQWYTHDEIEADGAIGTTFNLKTQTADLLGQTRWGRVSGAVGLSGLLRQYEATGEEALTPAANSNSAGAFIYQEVPLVVTTDGDARVPRVQFGGRYDLYRIKSLAGDEKFGPARSLDFNNVSGSVGLTLPLSESFTVAASAARAFRAPTVEELFSNAFHAANGTYDRGNSSLTAETNQGFDGEIRMESLRVNGKFGGYLNRVANFIGPDIVKDTTIDSEDGPVMVPLNQFSQAHATLKGVEGRIEIEVIPHLVLGAMGDMVRGSLRSGEPLPFIPAGRIGVNARSDHTHWSLSGDAMRSFAQDRVPPAVSADDASAVAAEAYTLVNLGATYTFGGAGRVNAVTLRADNLLDERYRDATSRIKTFAFNPGRNLSVVYKVLF